MIKNEIQCEFKVLRIIIQMQFGSEIALFCKLEHFKYIETSL